MRSESVRKEIPTYIDTICRPPSKPPDKKNSLEGEISKKISPYINPIYRPPPKPPNIQNTKGESVWVLEKESLCYAQSDCRLPPKTPDISKVPRIISIFDTDLNKDHTHREIQLALEIRPENAIPIC